MGRGRSGGTVALDPLGTLAAVTDPDSRAVVVLRYAAAEDPPVRAVRRIAVGAGPAQVAVGSDGRLFVTERLANSVSVYDAATGRLLCTQPVAADPVGVALAPDERTVYVTSGITHTLTALATDTLVPRFAVPVAREPRGLAIAPDGSRAFVAHLAGEPLSEVDLRGDSAVALATPLMPIPDEVRRALLRPPLDARRHIFRRWEPDFDFDGMNVSRKTAPSVPEVLPMPADGVPRDPRTVAPRAVVAAPPATPTRTAGTAGGMSSFPVVAPPPLAPGVVRATPAAATPPPLAVTQTAPLPVGLRLPATAHVTAHAPASSPPGVNARRTASEALPAATTRSRGASSPLPSQAWSVAVDPSGERVYVALMLNRTGRDVPREARRDAYGAGALSPGAEPEKISFALGTLDVRARRWHLVLPEGVGTLGHAGRRIRIPTQVALNPADGSLLISGMGSSTLAVLHTDRGALRERALTPTVSAPCGVAVFADGTALVYSQFEHALEVRSGRGTSRVSTGGASLPPDVARGRALFYTANDARLSSGGLSCGGCHPDGRDDGLTWFLSQGPRQTPTLAGRVAHPFNWNGTQDTLAGNVVQTVRRLGGTGLPADDVRALVAFLERGLAAPVRPAVARDARIERGEVLFAGRAACDACHDPGRNFTDGASHELGGLRDDEARRRFDTPSLRYLDATAPYFHDGRYATLRELLTDPRHRMGHLADLDPDELDALQAYLETL